MTEEITSAFVRINEYYAINNEMLCGDAKKVSGRFGNEVVYKCDSEEEFKQRFENALSKIQGKYEEKAGENEVIEEIADDDLPVPADVTARMYSYLAYNDDIYYRDAEVMRKVDTTDKTKDIYSRLIRITAITRELLDNEARGMSDYELSEYRTALNTEYDNFVKLYGRIQSKQISRLFSTDSSYNLICALEAYDGEQFKDKTDIFYRRTIRVNVDVHENGKTYEVTLTNELKYAQLKIVKTSEDGNVAGFTFKVTRLADGASATYTTNAAGEIITDQMPVYVDADATQLYEYKVEEINVPDKYRTPDAQTITLTYGQTAEVSFYNQIARGTLEILKVDHDGVTPLEGAKFEITDDNGNVIATKTSGPDGKIKVDSILYGQYHWSEVMAPKGYELDDTVHDFAIEHDEQVIEITQENTPSVGSITAKKVDADGNAMPGVEFTLEYSTDDGATWAPVEARAEDSKPSIGGCTSAVVDGALITDENGVTTFNGLQVDNQTVTITYRLTETGTKSGNTLLAAPLFIGSLPQVLDDGTEIVDVTVTAVNNQNYTLPSSGGNGMVSVPVGIALALISVSCFAAWLWKKKLF